MKVSKKAYYGLRAIVALAHENKALSIHVLAELEKLPETYLEKILQSLRRAGLVEAKKGTTGGYTLARESKDISVWDVLTVLDGPLKTFSTPIKGVLPASNAVSVATAGWPCPPSSHCQTNQVWRILEEEVEKTLSKITIKELTKQRR